MLDAYRPIIDIDDQKANISTAPTQRFGPFAGVSSVSWPAAIHAHTGLVASFIPDAARRDRLYEGFKTGSSQAVWTKILPALRTSERARRHGLESLKTRTWTDTPRPTTDAFFHTERILDLLANYPLEPTRVVASAEGGLAIVFASLLPRYADIEVLNSGEIIVTVSEGKGDPDVAEVTMPYIATALERISAFLS